MSARATANRGDQAGLLSRARGFGAKNLHGFDSINAIAATATAAQVSQLMADPSVAGVFPDLPLTKGVQPAVDTPKAATPNTSASPQSGICPTDPAKPLLQPEALGVTNTAFANSSTPQAQSIVDGKGIKVAWIADGVDTDNPDFIRADGTHVFIDYQDFSGDGIDAVTGGAEAFGDASSIASQGRQVYDLSQYVNVAHPLPAGCNITIRGVAPGASLIGLKVFGNAPTAPTSRFIQAIDYAVAAGADVLNESFGGNPYADNGDDPITLADKAAVAAGVTVVASTGDAGTTSTIGSPSSSSAVISVAATTTFQSYLQEDGAGSAALSNGTWISNNISGLSSGGFTQQGRVPDLSAPGDLGWALCTPTDQYEECTDNNGNPAALQNFGGTSQSSPLTAGAAALVIEAYENTHHGARPAPALVKRFLTSTATDLGHPAYEQGAGLLNSLGAVKAAMAWHDGNGSPQAHGTSQLVTDRSQATLSGNAGTAISSSFSVRNVSGHTVTVKASTRSFENIVSDKHGSVDIDTATSPFYIDAFGISRSFATATFTVGKVDRLDVSEAVELGPVFASRIILIDPSGAFAAYSIPQGASNFAHIDVRAPKAGKWTAYFALSTGSGFAGTFHYEVVQTKTTTHGSLTPSSITLGPGATGTFRLHTTEPVTPSDLSTSVQLTSSDHVTASVPVTLRGIIPPKNTTFTGVITGGNGRGFAGTSNYYYLDVPGGKKDLSVGVTFSDPGQLVLGFLIAPDGQVYSLVTNGLGGSALQMYRRNPQRGRWTVALAVTNPVSGLETAQKFKVKIAYDTVKISAANLPTSPGKHLTAGVPVTVPVTVKNTSDAPMVYFADGRLSTIGKIPLLEQSGDNTDIPLPVPAGVSPNWLVPTEVTQLNFLATADQPVNLDVFFQTGDPDLYSAALGNGASVQANAAFLSPSFWVADIGQTGPFDGPAPTGSVSIAASAMGQLFDPAVTSSTGDFWSFGVDPGSADASPAFATAVKNWQKNMLPTLRGQKLDTVMPSAVPADAAADEDGPLVLFPGETGTILVTITPTATPGTVVHGHLYIDSFDPFAGDGDELIDLPYSYVVSS